MQKIYFFIKQNYVNPWIQRYNCPCCSLLLIHLPQIAVTSQSCGSTKEQTEEKHVNSFLSSLQSFFSWFSLNEDFSVQMNLHIIWICKTNPQNMSFSSSNTWWVRCWSEALHKFVRSTQYNHTSLLFSSPLLHDHYLWSETKASSFSGMFPR